MKEIQKNNKQSEPPKNTFSDLLFHLIFAIILPFLIVREIKEYTETWIRYSYYLLWIFLAYSILNFFARLINARLDTPIKFLFFKIKSYFQEKSKVKNQNSLFIRRFFNYSINDKQRNVIAVAIPLIFYVIVYTLAIIADEKWGESRKISAFNFVTTWQYWIIGILIVLIIEIKLFESKEKKP